MTHSPEMVDTDKEPYPWHLLGRTTLFIASFLALGLCETLRGPTLLDLKDLLHSSVAEISIILTMGSIGSLVGCFAVGVLMDRLVRLRYLVLGCMLSLLGICSALLPYTPNIPTIYTAAFFSGLGSGAFDSGNQVLLLDVWKGRDAGPYMHALHFTFGVGASLSPIIAKPFLSNFEEVDVHTAPEDEENNTDYINVTNTRYELDKREYILSQEYNVRMLYPLVGALPILLSLGYIVYFLVDLRKDRETDKEDDKDEAKCKEKDKEYRGRKILILAILLVFFFLYVGLEVAFGTYLTIFGVESKLGLSRKEGSDLTAVFWGSFATMRGIAIPMAIYVEPEVTMIFSFICCLVSSFLLALFAEASAILLFICAGFMGIGTASVFATGLLWLERRMKITNRISAALTISASLGAKTFPVIVGQTVENYPMSFMYVVLGISIGCTLIFILCSLLSRSLLPTRQPESEESVELEVYPEALT